MKAKIQVQLVFKTDTGVEVRSLEVPDGLSVSHLLRTQSALPAFTAIGVFGKRVRESARLNDGDRVELYRPIIADAKLARRARSAVQVKTAQKGLMNQRIAAKRATKEKRLAMKAPTEPVKTST
jgi:uncharacterized protein